MSKLCGDCHHAMYNLCVRFWHAACQCGSARRRPALSPPRCRSALHLMAAACCLALLARTPSQLTVCVLLPSQCPRDGYPTLNHAQRGDDPSSSSSSWPPTSTASVSSFLSSPAAALSYASTAERRPRSLWPRARKAGASRACRTTCARMPSAHRGAVSAM